MLSHERRSIAGLILLGAGVFAFRQDHGSVPGYLLSTALVMFFWYLNGLSLALSSLRNILLLAALFGAAVIAVRLVFPSAGDSAKMGLLAGGDLDPAMIARLKESNEIALTLYFDHRPGDEERYYKVGGLASTRDGIHYSNQPVKIALEKLPKALEWVRLNIGSSRGSGRLGPDLDKIKGWFRESFSYSLSPGALRSAEPLDEFLFESRKGFCEHFAASLATLLKLSGYQTRVSVGYAGGSWNPLFHVLTFVESDAHAWVEALDPTTKKWRLIDPTEWVRPGTFESRSGELMPWGAAALFALLILALIYFRPRRFDGIERLLDKLGAIETKHRLESAGLTLAERMTRIASLHPDRAQGMQRTLSLYLGSYFRNEPTRRDRRLLISSLSGW